MTTADEYLSRVRRAMAGMQPSVRDDILRELRSHIADASAANGGNVEAALARLGPPEEVGRGYRHVYGYGRAVRIGFVIVGILLAVPTVPVLGITEEAFAPYGLSTLLLVALIGWLLWVSTVAGSRVGLYAGTAAAGARIVAFAIVALTQPGATAALGGLALFLIISGLLPVLGWLPGTAKMAWRGPRTEL